MVMDRRKFLAGGVALAGAALLPAIPHDHSGTQLTRTLAGRLADVVGGFRSPPGL